MSPRNLVLAASYLAAAACLPEAGPGVGERRIAGRGLGNLAAAPAMGAEARTLFFTRTQTIPAGSPGLPPQKVWDLFMSRPGHPEQLVLGDTVPYDHLRFDTRGRLYIAKGPAPTSAPPAPGGGAGGGQIIILDPATGGRIELGSSPGGVGMSPGGSQYHFITPANTTMIRTADDVVRELPHRIGDPVFVDEVLYARDTERRLWRVRPDGSPAEVLAENLDGFLLVPRPAQPPAFVLFKWTAGCPQVEARLLRPESVPPTELLGIADGNARVPGPGLMVLDGKVVLHEPGRTTTEAAFQVITLEPRSMRRFVVPSTADTSGRRPTPVTCQQVVNSVQVAFRPGTEEIWALAPRMLTIIGADGGLQTHTGPFEAFHVIPRLTGELVRLEFSSQPRLRPNGSPFTASGGAWAYWDGQRRLQVASASAPGAPGLTQLPDSVRVVDLADLPGAMTTVVWSTMDEEKVDLHLYDGDLTVRRKTIPDVRSLLFGERRLVVLSRGLVHDSFAPADLDLIDLPGNEVRRLGANVTEFLNLPACLTCDPTAPGAGVAYVTSARVPWKYDGLWTATMP